MKTETIVGLFIIVAIGVFFYLSISIGSFRFDKDRYDFYKAYFDDTGGLEVKDQVKIAGVDVGWVERISLDPSGKAIISFRIRKENKLAKNAYAIIRQETFLGNKYLEVATGDSSTGILLPGSALGRPSQAPPTIGDLLNKFGDIADSINQVASSLKSVVASREGEDNLKQAISGFAKASESIANFSGVLERALERNENNLSATFSNFEDVTGSLKKGVPSFTDNFKKISSGLDTKFFPGVDSVTTKLADNTLPQFTSDFKSFSSKTGKAMESLEDVSVQAREGFREAEQVMEKINTGKGLVGKLINEDETYTDFRRTIRNFKDQTTKMQQLDVLVDMHSESMIRDWNSKGYLDIKLRPAEDYFYNIQLAVDERGSIDRKVYYKKRFDSIGNQITTENDFHPDVLEVDEQTKWKSLFGFQFGKRFDHLALRVGLFEGTFGMGADYYIPLRTDKFHWISSFEAFDFRGINRRDDTRPHVKWLNRIFFLRNLYTNFGVDDMFSKKTATPFFGAGFKFGDRDLKYVLPSLPVTSLGGGK
ncbi:MCE family protein [Candidatus Babeliales bacterium]|nr:MCE family protein [Candidatus Babeliales bacterium]